MASCELVSLSVSHLWPPPPMLIVANHPGRQAGIDDGDGDAGRQRKARRKVHNEWRISFRGALLCFGAEEKMGKVANLSTSNDCQ